MKISPKALAFTLNERIIELVDRPLPRLGIQGLEKKMQHFIDTADSRETSPELMDAILFVADGNESEAVRIWEEPTAEEAVSIWERVTKNGLVPSTEFCWGASGSKWAATLDVFG